MTDHSKSEAVVVSKQLFGSTLVQRLGRGPLKHPAAWRHLGAVGRKQIHQLDARRLRHQLLQLHSTQPRSATGNR